MTLSERFTGWFHHEAAGGILLIIAAILAMIMANTPLSHIYDLLLSTPITVAIGTFEIKKALLLWVNDGLMTVFFLLVGLELKREFLEGELANPRNIALPAVAALGGMAIPSAMYAAINWHDPLAINGWAIPAATDIAFALGILSLLGSRVPVSLKIFLTSVAIFDDVGAIIVIALFYTNDISFTALGFAAVCLVILGVMNWRGVTSIRVYGLVGLIMWVALLKSSVHATLAGVLLAFFIPLKAPVREKAKEFGKVYIKSPLRYLEHELHSPVAFFVLPVFAFANAGVDLLGSGSEAFLHSVPLGIAVGLFFGKQIGVFFFSWVAVKLGAAKLPQGMGYSQLYGVSLLCGIGFTMSLFIGSLAFPMPDSMLVFDERTGILVGSFVSAIAGYWVLRKCLPQQAATSAPAPGISGAQH
ncbi:Na+/H+ antiporter NhaA [Teredinibacter turnerae]|uniref:Na+/H+ antiporter NhaA n=1 Tax=Teredinibacter turnerae TaxID=2426 RepID=UPI0005F799B3|nr:Na+/H+ antiporter NhaA [Teredinibacter turnerae]